MHKIALMKKSTTILKRSSVTSYLLDSIKIGDSIGDEYGKTGLVCDIEKVQRNRETQYYFNIGKSGTILFLI